MSLELAFADIVMVGGSSLISKVIEWGQQAKGQPRIGLSHAAMVVHPHTSMIVSADWPKVRLKSLYEYADGKHVVAIYRAKNIHPAIKQRMAIEAEQRVGRPYPWAELILHLIDNKLFGGEYKARAFGSKYLEKCTEIPGVIYQKYGYSFGVEGRALEPDDMWQFITDPERSYYECVKPLGPLVRE